MLPLIQLSPRGSAAGDWGGVGADATEGDAGAQLDGADATEVDAGVQLDGAEATEGGAVSRFRPRGRRLSRKTTVPGVLKRPAGVGR